MSDNQPSNSMQDTNVPVNQGQQTLDSQSTPALPSRLVAQISFTGMQRITPPRRMVDGNLLRENISNVIREFQPFVETARTVNAISFSNLLSRPSVERQNSNQHSDSNSVVINLEGVQEEPHDQHSESNFHEIEVHSPNASNAFANESSGGESDSDDTFHNLAEAQQYLKIFQKYLPFLFLLTIKGLYDHCDGIINLVILVATFIHANNTLKLEAAKQTRRSLSSLFIAFGYITVCLAYINCVFMPEKLYLNLILLQQRKETSIWSLIWILIVADFVLKLITIMFKIVVAMLPVKFIPHHRRGKIYLFIEALSQFYRSLATVQPWLVFLLESYEGTEKIVGVFLSAIYMISKGGDLMSGLKLLKTATIKLLQNMALGAPPSKEEISEAGNSCPICHDEYDSPVLLQCKHIFCEGCVCTWLDREQTCPLCRAKIVDDPSWRDGSTSLLVQVF